MANIVYSISVRTTLHTVCFTFSSSKALAPNQRYSFGKAQFVGKILDYDEYVYGTPLKIRQQPGGFGYLSLPTATLANQCVWSSPIQYLANSQSSCSVRINRTNCASLSTINSKSFLSAEGKIEFVSRSRRSDLPGQNVAQQAVQYLCSKTANNYPVISQNVSYWFPSNKDAAIVTAQGRFSVSGCLQKGQTPRFNQSSAFCENVVQSVSYTFGWKESTLVSIAAEVKLVNLSLPSESSSVNFEQFFEAQFRHVNSSHRELANQRNESSSNHASHSQVPRSGNPGYDAGKPLIAAFVNETKPSDQDNAEIKESPDIQYSRQNQLFIFRPDASGLCAFASLEHVRFKQNTDSGCFLQLRKDDFRNCSSLSDKILEGLKLLLSANLLSRFGTLQTLVPDNFVQILNESTADTEGTIIPVANPANQKTEFNDSITVEANVTAGNKTAPITPQTRATTSAPKTTTPSRNKPPEATEGRSLQLPFDCQDVPYHMKLEVMFAKSVIQPPANGDDRNVYEIIGAYVHYDKTRWTFDAVSESKRYFVQSSVRFLERPPEKPLPIKRYYLEERRDYCPSEITCWKGLFYPFVAHSDRSEHDDNESQYEYAISFGLATAVFVIAAAIVTRPLS